MPDIVFASKDAIPEGLREFAEEKDGKIVVDVAPNVKLKEFRDNNIKANKERDASNAAMATIKSVIGHDDFAKFANDFSDLKAVAQKVADGELKGSDAITKEVTTRLAAAQKAVDEKVAGIEKERDTSRTEAATWKTAFKRQTLRQALTNVVVEADSGAEMSALPDILARGESVFVVKDDGTLEAREGESVLYSRKDTSKSMDPKEWLATMLESAPHLRKLSAGGGAAGGRDGLAQYGGLSKEAWDKLSPSEQITRFRKAQG